MISRPYARRHSQAPRRLLAGYRKSVVRRRLNTESLEARALLAADVLHNASIATDVNFDGSTSPIDALYVINKLNMDSVGAVSAVTATGTPDLFYDVSNDGYVSPLDAVLVLNSLNAEGEVGDIVQIRLAVTDLAGNDIASLGVGQDFQLRAYVKDLTGRTNGGVFAAYLDVTYPSNLTAVTGPITRGPDYPNSPAGSTATAGLINEVGSIAGLTALGPDERLLFTVPMRTSAAGTISFVPDPADLTPAHDTLVFGVPAGQTLPVVPPDKIDYITDTLLVTGAEKPTAVADTYQAVKGQTLTVNAAQGILANDTNPVGGSLTAAVVTTTTNGTLTLNADGSFTYSPTADFVGSDSFTYTAAAGNVVSDPATVTINVAAPNAKPVANADTYSVNEDALLTSTVSVLSNDTDADSNPLTAVVVTQPAHGVLTLQPNGQFTYDSADNYFGTDTFTYRANDGTENSDPATVTINVIAVNDAPTAQGNTYSIAAGGTLTVTPALGVLANDSDIEGDALTAQLVTNVTHGALTLNADGSFNYTPTAGYTGNDQFTYVAKDATASSAAATVTISVTGNEEKQVRFRLEVTNTAGDAITSIGPGGSFILKAYVQDISTLPREGVFSPYLDVLYPSNLVSVNGSFTYGEKYPNQKSGSTTTLGVLDEVGAFDGLTPLGEAEQLVFSIPMLANQAGTATFTSNGADVLPAHDVSLYGATQPVPASQIDFGTVQLVIASGNPPVAVADSYQTNEDVVLTVTQANGVLANDSDPNSNPLTAQLVTTTTNGVLTLNANGSFTYTPKKDFAGDDSFTYRANNGAQNSATVTVAIKVNPVDDAPEAVDDTYRIESAGPLTVTAANGVLANDRDAEGQAMAASLVGAAANGTVNLKADGSFVYTPKAGFVGQDSFTYRVTAGGLTSRVATVTITVGDLTPSSITGIVYTDIDNDGVIDAGEARFGNVRITLKGSDLLGREVNREVRTAADGRYTIADVIQGNYTLTEFQPMMVIDGKDTYQGTPSLRNDRFEIKLGAGQTVGDYNFGERGLEPQFIRDPAFFASRTAHGVLAALDTAGAVNWYCFDAGWADLRSVDVQLGSGKTSAVVTATGSSGRTDTAVIGLNGNRDVRLAGSASTGYLLRIQGDPIAYGLDPDAIDAAFGGPDA